MSLKKNLTDNTLVENHKQSITLNLAKLFYILLLFYYGWFQMVFFQIPYMTSLLGIAMMFFILMHIIEKKYLYIRTFNIEIIFWLIFVITSLFTGMIVAKNISLMLSSVLTFLQYLIMIYGMVYISLHDKKIDFFINTFIVFSLVCALTTIFWGVNYTSIRVSMSEITNPNTLGLIMVIAVFCILYILDFKRIVPTILLITLMFTFIYVIILSGSRKSFLSIAIMLLLWFTFIQLDILKNKSKHKVINFLILLLAMILGAYFFVSFVTESSMFLRLERLLDSGDEARLLMYSTAVELFKQNPIIGVGINNYRVLTYFQTYSHSTYAEILVSTGLIGTIIYFIPYISQFFKIVKLIRSENNYIVKKVRLLGIMLLIILLLGIGVIHFYSMYVFIVFGFIISFCTLNYKTNTT